MPLPEGFGEFWPSGGFEFDAVKRKSGWASRLNAYYFQQNPEAQTTLGAGRIMIGDYGFFVNGKFANEVGTSLGRDPPLSPIQGHEAPRTFDTEKGQKTLGSLIMLNDSILAADDAFKSIIHRLEPGIHQFFPIEIRMPRGKILLDQYHVLVIGRYFDAYSQNDTEFGSVHEYPTGVVQVDTSKSGLNGLAVRKSVFSNAHLWRDRRFKADLTCFSDELMAEIDKVGLRLPKHHKMKVV